ncbi:MAG: hypothetical protein GYB31_15545 [Bacteroidetes bacterium]|nr:hypothetical protein [Bacteroidota bacterium]
MYQQNVSPKLALGDHKSITEGSALLHSSNACDKVSGIIVIADWTHCPDGYNLPAFGLTEKSICLL